MKVLFRAGCDGRVPGPPEKRFPVRIMRNTKVLTKLIIGLGLLGGVMTCFQLDDAQAGMVNPSNNFLIVTDLHVNSSKTDRMQLCPFDATRSNDLDAVTMDIFLKSITNGICMGQIATPDFVIFLGDIVRHERGGASNSIADEYCVFKALLKTFPQIPIFYVYGNHDSLFNVWGPIVDPNIVGSNCSPYNIAMNTGWSNGFLSTGNIYTHSDSNAFPCIINYSPSNGYYSAYLQKNLRLVAVNSVTFTPQRLGVTEQDAQNELDWLAGELAAAAAGDESVLIALHVPFGRYLTSNENYWLAGDQQRFLSIFRNYKNIIIGVLAGHTHTEEMRILVEEQKSVNGEYYTAALSTASGNSPAFRTVYYSMTNSMWVLNDAETFNFANGAHEDDPLMQSLYQFRPYYGPAVAPSMIACLSNVTANKIDMYFTAGNTNFTIPITHPSNLYINLPFNTPSSLSFNLMLLLQETNGVGQ